MVAFYEALTMIVVASILAFLCSILFHTLNVVQREREVDVEVGGVAGNMFFDATFHSNFFGFF